MGETLCIRKDLVFSIKYKALRNFRPVCLLFLKTVSCSQKQGKQEKWGKHCCYLDRLIFGASTERREPAKKGVQRRCASLLSND